MRLTKDARRARIVSFVRSCIRPGRLTSFPDSATSLKHEFLHELLNFLLKALGGGTAAVDSSPSSTERKAPVCGRCNLLARLFSTNPRAPPLRATGVIERCRTLPAFAATARDGVAAVHLASCCSAGCKPRDRLMCCDTSPRWLKQAGLRMMREVVAPPQPPVSTASVEKSRSPMRWSACQAQTAREFSKLEDDHMAMQHTHLTYRLRFAALL